MTYCQAPISCIRLSKHCSFMIIFDHVISAEFMRLIMTPCKDVELPNTEHSVDRLSQMIVAKSKHSI